MQQARWKKTLWLESEIVAVATSEPERCVEAGIQVGKWFFSGGKGKAFGRI